jgi:hypothetical protein
MSLVVFRYKSAGAFSCSTSLSRCPSAPHDILCIFRVSKELSASISQPEVVTRTSYRNVGTKNTAHVNTPKTTITRCLQIGYWSIHKFCCRVIKPLCFGIHGYWCGIVRMCGWIPVVCLFVCLFVCLTTLLECEIAIEPLWWRQGDGEQRDRGLL